MDDALDSWFKSEVVIHDEALTRYLRRSWPRSHEVNDLRQEIYLRVYAAARTHIPDVARTFIFAVARRLIIDRLRHQRVVAIDSVTDFETLNVLVDDISPERDMAAHQELRKLAEALDGLSPKCREVVWMRRIDDLSQKEVAERLGLSERAVERYIMKGMKRLAEAYFGEHEAADEDEAGCKPVEVKGDGKQQTD